MGKNRSPLAMRSCRSGGSRESSSVAASSRRRWRRAGAGQGRGPWNQGNQLGVHDASFARQGGGGHGSQGADALLEEDCATLGIHALPHAQKIRRTLHQGLQLLLDVHGSGLGQRLAAPSHIVTAGTDQVELQRVDELLADLG